MKETIKNFIDLEVWKEGHSLVLIVYSYTKKFPKEELFGLSSQMRRCAVSITSNVAEGFSRGTMKEKSQFYTIAKGSLTELHSQIYVARDLKYITEDEFQSCVRQIEKVSRLLTGIIRSSRARM